jgi:parallel beta-helix repeat protein
MRTLAMVALLVCPLGVVAPGRAADCGGGLPCGCGDTVVGTATLDADLGPCDGPGLVLRGRAVLDCGGHQILGRPPATSTTAAAMTGGDKPRRTIGVLLDGTTGALVRRCRVSGFTYGIELNEARDSEVVASEVFRNGDFGARVGYGIHLSRAQRSTIRECKVHHSADEGIHVGAGSNDNTLAGNEAWDNGRENFYVLSARGTRLLRNQGRGTVSANLYMKHATDSVVEGNRFAERPVVVRGHARGNTFTDNVFGAGLKLEPYGERQDGPADNLVRGGRLSGDVCLELTEARDNRFEEVSLQGCRGVVARATRPATNHLLDVDVAGVRLDLLGGATLRLLAPVRVAARGKAGNPVAGARVEIRDATGELHPSAPTDGGGAVRCLVPTHRINAAGLIALTPVTLTLHAPGYAEARTVLADPLTKELTVTLVAEGTPRLPARRTRPAPRRGPIRPISVP